MGYLRETHSKWKTFKMDLKTKNRFIYEMVDWTETIIIALILALIIRKYIIQTSMVPTGSMIPTLNIGDRLFVNKFIYRFVMPKRSDIIVFKSPYKNKNDYVKRCIGLPGEKIQIIKGVVYINDKQLVLPGVNVQRDYSFYGPVSVPEKSYFALGDNRGNSQDSRVWGFVPENDLLGKAWFTFWPLNRMRLLR
ncbi:signal peptidase I [Thermoproteota archaeon]